MDTTSKQLLDRTLVTIPAGRFRMGSTATEVDRCVSVWSDRLVDSHYARSFRDWISKEQPDHEVDLPSFSLARFPVTNGEFSPYADAAGVRVESLTSGGDDHPVWGLTRDVALAYAAWLAEGTGVPYRLPTEPEWEWAARGPDRLEHPWGQTFDPACCNTIEGGLGATTPVDNYPNGVSPFGIWDMGGNVEEYTADDYAPYPGGSVVDDDLLRLLGPNYPILRGGSFALGGDLTRCARRHGPHPEGVRFRYTGVRLAADLVTS